jgi:hypothetical protein
MGMGRLDGNRRWEQKMGRGMLIWCGSRLMGSQTVGAACMWEPGLVQKLGRESIRREYGVRHI